MLTVQQIKSVIARHCKKYNIKQAYLFGSYAKNTASDDSDIDILLDSGSITTYDDYYQLHKSLEADLGKKVDLLTMDGINPRFYNLIKHDRMPIYAA